MAREEFEEDNELENGVSIMKEYELHVKDEIRKTEKMLEEDLYPSIKIYFQGRLDILKQLEECFDFLDGD